MKGLIVITAYNKPELLYINLKSLFNQIKLNTYDIIIATEEGYDKEIDNVVDFFNNYKILDIKTKILKKYNDRFIGMRNILSTYLYGLEKDYDFVIPLEEDIIPTNDFLDFNEKVYNKFLKEDQKIFCLAHKRRAETEKIGKDNILIGDYQCTSPSIISKKSIINYLSYHLNNEDLYLDTINYYKKIFPNSRIPFYEHCHHDGFLERVMEKNNLFVLKPDLARSSHIGLSGVCTRAKKKVIGSLRDKISEYYYLMINPKELKERSYNPEDMVVAPLLDRAYHSPDNLILDTNRNIAEASSWWYDTNNDFKKHIDG